MKLQNDYYELKQNSSKCIKVRNLEKSYLYYGILTLTKSKYFIAYTIKLHCYQIDVLSEE